MEAIHSNLEDSFVLVQDQLACACCACHVSLWNSPAAAFLLLVLLIAWQTVAMRCWASAALLKFSRVANPVAAA